MGTAAAYPIEDVSDLLLLILRANSSAGRPRLAGITRLQKLVFLATRDPRYERLVREGQAPDVDFEPYKMGPFTPDIYEGVEALATFEPPLIEARGETTGIDAIETARYLEEVDLEGQVPLGRSQIRPMEYRLSPSGQQVANALWDGAPKDLREVVQEVVSNFGALPLQDLLRRVYTAYPEMTVRSEIRGRLGLT